MGIHPAFKKTHTYIKYTEFFVCLLSLYKWHHAVCIILQLTVFHSIYFGDIHFDTHRCNLFLFMALVVLHFMNVPHFNHEKMYLNF